ncbi:MAG: methyltransferase domain-containing protein [Polyangiaceae bacterium]|nr:methyltransferase domain-containing protein [Polyangiaceae bacterium]
MSALSRYVPQAADNRMKGPNDTVAARKRYYGHPSANLKLLVENRYRWMNSFIGPNDRGVELGAGPGFSRELVQAKELLITDYAESDWLDVKNVDAMATPFENGEFDFAISVNMIHHLAYPLRFFREMVRILRPGGRLIVQDVRCSLFLRAALRLQRHEGYDFGVDVYDESAPCTNPDNPWAGNNAVVDLLLAREDELARRVPELALMHRSYSEFLTLLNSGGVIATTAYVPLPLGLAKWVERADSVLTQKLPKVFASQVQLVFVRS